MWQINFLGLFWKQTFGFPQKLTAAIEKKLQSVIHHHENFVKSAQHHWRAPGVLTHYVLDKILNHTLTVAQKNNLVPFINYASDFFQIVQSCHNGIHTHFAHSNGLQSKLPWSFQNFQALLQACTIWVLWSTLQDSILLIFLQNNWRRKYLLTVPNTLFNHDTEKFTIIHVWKLTHAVWMFVSKARSIAAP